MLCSIADVVSRFGGYRPQGRGFEDRGGRPGGFEEYRGGHDDYRRGYDGRRGVGERRGGGLEDGPRSGPPPHGGPAERPRLQLQPRSKPAAETDTGSTSAIFGGARPVDTAAKEQKIEERLKQEEQLKREEGLKRDEEEEERLRKEVRGGQRAWNCVYRDNLTSQYSLP